MKLSNIIILSLIFLNIFVDCNNVGHNTKVFRTNNIKIVDTIKYDKAIVNNDCKKKSQGYYQKYGFVISNFYEVLQYDYTIDIDKDGIKDTIAILAPKNMILPSVNHECYKEKKSNRILLLKTLKEKKIFENVIRNDFGFATPGIEFIKDSPNGFVLYYYFGSNCYTKYYISIEYSKIYFDYYITSIKIETGCNNKIEKKIEINYKLNEFPLSKYRRNIIDSISSNF